MTENVRDSSSNQYRLLQSPTALEKHPISTQRREYLDPDTKQRPFTIARKPLPQHAYTIVSLDTDDSSPRTDRHLLAWRPFYSRFHVVCVFVLIFSLLLAVVETLYQVSQKRSGIASSHSNLHYLWTYGPCAVFVLIAAFWARVDHQIRELAPWRNMLEKPTEARKSVLLDYVSASLPGSLITALSNRYFVVSATTLCNLLLQLLIVFSTALFVLEPSSTLRENLPLDLLSSFDTSQARLSRKEILPFYLLDGIQRGSVRYPLGVTPELAYETFNTTTESPSAVFTSEVNVLIGHLNCAKAEINIGQWWADSVLEQPDINTASYHLQGQMAFATSDCIIFDVLLTPNVLLDYQNMTYFATYDLGHCGFSNAGTDARVLVVAGEAKFETPVRSSSAYDAIPFTSFTNGNSLVLSRTNITMQKSVQYICTPAMNSNIARVKLSQSQHEIAEIESEPELLIALQSLPASFNQDLINIGIAPPITPRNPLNSSADVESPLLFGMNQMGWPSAQFETLLEDNNLPTVADRYFGAITALYAHTVLRQTTNGTAIATVETLTNRLRVETLPVRVIEVVLAILIVLSIYVAIRIRDFCVTPKNPTTMMGLATLIRRSPDVLRLFTNTGSATLQDLRKYLRDRNFISGIVSRHHDRYFTISVVNDELGKLSLPCPRRLDERSRNRGWQPFAVKTWSRVITCLILVVIIVVLQVLLRLSQKHQGLSNTSLQSHVHYAWAYIPALIFVAFSLWLSVTDFYTRCLSPFVDLRRKTADSYTLNRDYSGTTSGMTLLKAAIARQWAIFTTASAAFLAAMSIVAISGVYLVAEKSITSNVHLQTTSTWSPTPIATTSNFGSPSTELLATGLILYANATYPEWTYGEFAFRRVEVVDGKTSRSDPAMQANEQEIHTRVTASRGDLECKVYSQQDFTVGFSWSTSSQQNQDQGQLSFNFTQQICGSTTYGMSAVPTVSNGYFGHSTTLSNNSCGGLLMAWGQMKGKELTSFSAMACNQTFNDVDVDVMFVGQELAISSSPPPTADLSTVRPAKVAEMKVDYSSLPTITSPNGTILDPLLTAAVYGRNGIPVQALGDPNQATKVSNRIKQVHSIYAAQYLNTISRVPITTATTTTTTDATLTHPSQPRLIQDPTATHILTVLLLLTLLSMAASIILLPDTATRNATPKNPCSIAAKLSLLADSSLLTRVYLAEDAERMSDADVHAALRGVRFGMDWVDHGDGRRVFAVEPVGLGGVRGGDGDGEKG